MAIITLASPISGIRGKVGGNIFSANKSGPYLKAWGRGSNPNTERQTIHRTKLVAFSQNWQALTSGQRTGWRTYAALPAQDKTNSLGETFSASGFNWYVAINLNLLSVGDAPRDIAPTLGTPAAPSLTNFSFKRSLSAVETFVRFDVASPVLTEPHVILAAVVNSLGTQIESEIKTFMVAEIPDVNREIKFQVEIETAFGTIQIGQQLSISIASQDSDGRRSTVITSNRNAGF